MALFQNENSSADAINYKTMGKDQLIMLIQSQKSDIDVLLGKLSKAEEAGSENERLTQQAETLIAENESLRAKNEELEQKLAYNEDEITEPGSIAEMAIRVNGVMEAAQKAADDYLNKIKKMHDDMRLDYEVYELKAQQKAEAILQSADSEAKAIVQKARDEANDIWSTLQGRFNSYVDDKKAE